MFLTNKLYLILFSLLFFVILNSCVKEVPQPLELDFCEMYKQDQSHTYDERLEESERIENAKIRDLIFEKNFNLLIEKTKESGFPNVSYWDHPLDTCKFNAVRLTIVHMMQAHPEKIFDEQIVKLFEQEIANGNKIKEHIHSAIIISSVTSEFCEDLRVNIEIAMKDWDIDDNVIEKIKYKPCDS